MTRAERRRAHRARQKHEKKAGERLRLDEGGQRIKLENPVAQHYEKFIVGNSQYCDNVLEADSRTGQTVVICGAGPSLRDHAAEWCPQADEVWGCNSALTWLIDEGHKVTHGFCIDQTPAMLNEWASAPDVDYLLASTVHPHLTEHLLRHERTLHWFHNFVGINRPAVAYCECGHDEDQHDGPCCTRCDECEGYDERAMAYEDWMYTALYPPTARAGSGLNSVSRAIDIAHFLGFERIVILGADCALRLKSQLSPTVEVGSAEHIEWLETQTEMHADGGSALASGATGVTLGGEVDGRWWESKPDLIITAVFLVKMQQAIGADRLIMIGDTLPNALVGKDDDFLRRLPALTDSDGNSILPSVPS